MTARFFEAGPSLVITVDRSGPAVVAQVKGEIDLATRDEFQAGVDDAMAGDPLAVVIDVREVGFMGSLGLAVLVQAHQRAEDLGIPFYLVTSADGVIPRLLDIAGLSQVFSAARSVEDALAGAVGGHR